MNDKISIAKEIAAKNNLDWTGPEEDYLGDQAGGSGSGGTTEGGLSKQHSPPSNRIGS